ncbi:MAG: alpha/beta hydrolase [Rhodoglobus sp.]|mgnify:CR=1 FL=1|uniref:alpha/beta fold hydrolase n=1 Tax=uncultured Salinibacterium sp. TaxID=459274 RepID=UPI0030DBE312|tara:strand:+ start:1281 stop:2033 length:753 start_codon:yes stop_codon:yes gene_type:complete
MHVILIPGFWLDGDSWAPVTRALRDAGHTAHPLTLPGLRRRDTHRATITLADHIAAVVEVVDGLAHVETDEGEDGSEGDQPTPRIALVAHSGGGPIAHAVADARPTCLARIVHVDTVPLPDGMPINAELPIVEGEIPLPNWSVFDDEDLVDLTEELREWFREIAIPQPALVASSPQSLSTPARFSVPATVICCEFPSAQVREWMRDGAPFAAELAQLADLELIDLPTGHWPQFTKPEELADAIITALDRT